MQSRIEGGDPVELEDNVLASYDRAYRWPRDYAAAVATVGMFSEGVEPLAQNLIDGELHPTDAGATGRSAPGLLSALRDPNRTSGPPTLGFDPTTGRAVYYGCGMLTNVPFHDLRGVMDSRSGATVLDTRLLNRQLARSIVYDTDGSPRQVPLYRVGSDEDVLDEFAGYLTRIALDPLKDITTLKAARIFARALLEVSTTAVDTTVESVAFTFLAIAAFSGDTLTTVNRVLEWGGHPGPETHAAAFRDFWSEFRSRHHAGAKLALPSFAALRLLDGFSRAQESGKIIDIGSAPVEDEHNRLGRNVLPEVKRPEVLLAETTDTDTVIFYNGDVAPETPIAFNVAAPGWALAFYQVTQPPGLLGLSHSHLTYRSIGIASDTDDLSVIAHHRADRVDTLTNQVGRFAVFCDSGRASVVWLPPA